MSLLYYLNWGAVIYGAYKTGLHVVVMDKVTQKYQEWRTLNKTLDEMQVNKTKLYLKMFNLMTVYVITSLKQKYNTSVKRIDNTKLYELTYVINNKLYKQVINPQRGPNPIVSITDEDGLDLFEIIIPYIGPRYDWHRSELNPEFFGCKTLKFIMLNGDTYTFNSKTLLSPVISFIDHADDMNVKSKTI